MKSIAFVALFVAAWGCSAQPAAKEGSAATKPAAFGQQFIYKDAGGKQRLMSIPDGTFNCVAGGGPTVHNCKEIPIIVLTNATDCLVIVPYHDLKVGNTKKDDDVTWRLFPTGYEFNATSGIRIWSTTGADVSKVWIKPDGTRKHTYSWTLKHGAPKGSFNHEANVIDSKTKKACIPGDPVIANDAN